MNKEWKQLFLRKVYAIDWAQLRHAYGAADDVPELIEDLLDDDEATRQEALNEFCSNIYHQGTIYEATAYAVPFFLELMTNQEVETVKLDLFALLCAIYDGHYRHEVSRNAKDEVAKGKLVLEEFYYKNISNDKGFFGYIFENYPDFIRLLNIKIDHTKVESGEMKKIK